METGPKDMALGYVFTLSVDIAGPIEVGQVGAGNRRVIPITGGSLEGPDIRGKVLSAGADFMMVRENRTVEVNARYVVQMDDGANVYVENNGIRTGPKDEPERLKRGETINPDEIYFRTTPKFETASAKYGWLMEFMFAGTARRRPEGGGVIIDIYRVM